MKTGFKPFDMVLEKWNHRSMATMLLLHDVPVTILTAEIGTTLLL